MWKSTFFVTAILLTSSLAGLTACKSDTQKTLEHTQDLITARQDVANEIASMGSLDASWSDEKIKLLESRVNRLEDLEAQLKAMRSGHNGVRVKMDRDSSEGIRLIRLSIAIVRAQKAGSTSVVDNSQRLLELDEKSNQQRDELLKLGEPSENWPVDVLKTYLQKLEDLQASFSEIGRLAETNKLFSMAERADIKNRMVKSVQVLEPVRSKVNTLIGKKTQNNSTMIIPTAPSNVQPSQGISNSAIDAQIRALGTADINWTTEQFNDYAKKCDALTTQLQQQGASADQMKAVEEKKSTAAALHVKKIMGSMNQQVN